MGNQVDFSFQNLGAVTNYIKGGRMKALAVISGLVLLHRLGGHHADIADVAVVVIFVADMEARRVSGMDENVVLDRAIRTLAQP